MGKQDVGVHHVAMHDVAMHDVAMHDVGKHSAGVYCMSVHSMAVSSGKKSIFDAHFRKKPPIFSYFMSLNDFLQIIKEGA
jgi:hypothetical protein